MENWMGRIIFILISMTGLARPLYMTDIFSAGPAAWQHSLAIFLWTATDARAPAAIGDVWRTRLGSWRFPGSLRNLVLRCPKGPEINFCSRIWQPWWGLGMRTRSNLCLIWQRILHMPFAMPLPYSIRSWLLLEGLGGSWGTGFWNC